MIRKSWEKSPKGQTFHQNWVIFIKKSQIPSKVRVHLSQSALRTGFVIYITKSFNMQGLIQKHVVLQNRFQILALGWIKFLLTTMWLLVTKVDMAEGTRNTKEMNEKNQVFANVCDVSTNQVSSLGVLTRTHYF